MLNDNELTDFLASNVLSQEDKALLILAFSNGVPQKLSTIRDIGITHGLRRIEGWNLPRILNNAKGLAVKLPEGWKLTSDGLNHVKTKFGLSDSESAIKEIEIKLRSHLEKIANIDTRDFVEESIKCLEAKLYKSAIVMSWVGAMSLLYDHVISDRDRLKRFNERALETSSKKWKLAITKDDLMMMRESDFLDILAYLSILGKNTKERLKNFCLDLRNSCGHPSSIKIEEYTVQAHIEFLILNVYQCF